MFDDALLSLIKGSSVDQGRANTDRSLSAERAKTDRFAQDERGRHAEEFDEAARASHEVADRALRSLRAEGDAARDADRNVAGMSRAEERARADARLERERADVDRAAESARDRVDELKERERASLEAWIAELFGRERAATDENLSVERAAQDRAFARSAKFISDEQLAHGHTRESLHLRDEFLLLLSQDLKQPMLAIAVAADRLRRRVKHLGADEDDRQQVEIIQAMARDVLRLVGDLLERVALWREPGGDEADLGARRQGWLEAAERANRVEQRRGGHGGRRRGASNGKTTAPSKGKAKTKARPESRAQSKSATSRKSSPAAKGTRPKKR